MSKIFFSMMYH